MTTLLTYENGSVRRRCDARCHDAKGEDCECICNGMNHGAGARQAVANTQKLMEDVKLLPRNFKIPAHQLPLPEVA